MQLTKISEKLRPITLAAGIITATSLYANPHVDRQSSIVSMKELAGEYFRITDSYDNSYQEMIFKMHLRRWEENTMFMSSTTRIVENNDFQSIIAMGRAAVPFIVDEIERKPSSLVWALNIIFQKKITQRPNATISDACKLWVRELRK